MIDDIVQKFQHAAQRKQIALSTEFEIEVPNVVIDIGMTERVFENLIKNALEHTDSGGKILIIGRLVDTWVEIQVIDSGVGIDGADLINVFDRSFSGRSKSSQNSGKSGSGLGLSIAKKIMQLHGGSISVTSEVAHGSIFTLRWPAEAELQVSG